MKIFWLALFFNFVNAARNDSAILVVTSKAIHFHSFDAVHYETVHLSSHSWEGDIVDFDYNPLNPQLAILAGKEGYNKLHLSQFGHISTSHSGVRIFHLHNGTFENFRRNRIRFAYDGKKNETPSHVKFMMWKASDASIVPEFDSVTCEMLDSTPNKLVGTIDCSVEKSHHGNDDEVKEMKLTDDDSLDNEKSKTPSKTKTDFAFDWLTKAMWTARIINNQLFLEKDEQRLNLINVDLEGGETIARLFIYNSTVCISLKSNQNNSRDKVVVLHVDESQHVQPATVIEVNGDIVGAFVMSPIVDAFKSLSTNKSRFGHGIDRGYLPLMAIGLICILTGIILAIFSGYLYRIKRRLMYYPNAFFHQLDKAANNSVDDEQCLLKTDLHFDDDDDDENSAAVPILTRTVEMSPLQV